MPCPPFLRLLVEFKILMRMPGAPLFVIGRYPPLRSDCGFVPLVVVFCPFVFFYFHFLIEFKLLPAFHPPWPQRDFRITGRLACFVLFGVPYSWSSLPEIHKARIVVAWKQLKNLRDWVPDTSLFSMRMMNDEKKKEKPYLQNTANGACEDFLHSLSKCPSATPKRPKKKQKTKQTKNTDNRKNNKQQQSKKQKHKRSQSDWEVPLAIKKKSYEL